MPMRFTNNSQGLGDDKIGMRHFIFIFFLKKKKKKEKKRKEKESNKRTGSRD